MFRLCLTFGATRQSQSIWSSVNAFTFCAELGASFPGASFNALHRFSHTARVELSWVARIEFSFIMWSKVIDLALRDQFADSSPKLVAGYTGWPKQILEKWSPNSIVPIIIWQSAAECGCQIKLSVGLICFQQSQPQKTKIKTSSATHKSFKAKFDWWSLLADNRQRLRLGLSLELRTANSFSRKLSSSWPCQSGQRFNHSEDTKPICW